MNRWHGTTWAPRISRFAGVLALAAATAGFAGARDSAFGQSPRSLAPGVLTVIPPSPLPAETYTGPMALPELAANAADLNWTPNYLAKTETLGELSRRVVLRRPIWNLEFAFKPLRMVEVDLPQPSGKLQKKLVWYMVYRIRYFPNDLKPTPKRDPFGNETFPSTTAGESNPTPRFFPHFVFTSVDVNKSYLDQIIPSAKGPIEDREAPGVPLYNAIEITNIAVPVARDTDDLGVWGYVTWTDIDPRVNFFSIHVRGLTNAYQFEDAQGLFKAGDAPRTGRTFRSKTLQLNFWRPGDSVFQHEGEIRFGVPIESEPAEQAERLTHYEGMTERLDYQWIYR
ncbi:MAG: hypothetical protein FJ297_07775 [Planctomycetes bacterium]|nr:hypothetical protein [Planctomycetota bacterium]